MSELEKPLKETIEAIKSISWDLNIPQDKKTTFFNLLIQNDTLWQKFMNLSILDCLTDFNSNASDLPASGFFEVGQSK